MPFGTNAPKLWPADPLNLIWMVSSGRPAAPYFFVTSLPVMVPTTRLTLRIGSSAVDLLAALDRRLAQAEQRGDVERLVEAVILADLRGSGRPRGRRPARRGCC